MGQTFAYVDLLPVVFVDDVTEVLAKRGRPSPEINSDVENRPGDDPNQLHGRQRWNLEVEPTNGARVGRIDVILLGEFRLESDRRHGLTIEDF